MEIFPEIENIKSNERIKTESKNNQKSDLEIQMSNSLANELTLNVRKTLFSC